MNIAIEKLFKDDKPNNIFTYNEFIELSKKTIEDQSKLDLEGIEKTYFEYRKINLQRTNRIAKTYKINESLLAEIEKITTPQFWLIITEDWCGDSAQNLPYLMKYVDQNDHIDVKVILRDENVTALEEYFTEVNPKSIPKIIGFDKDGNELFVWGPRPKFAADLVKQLKAEGYSKEEFNKELHLWYAKNKGKELEKELFDIFRNCQNQY